MKNLSSRHSFTYLLGLIMLGTITTISSCCIPKEPTPPDYRINTTTDKTYVGGLFGSSSLGFEYNTDGRLKRMYLPSNNTDIKTYAYTTNQVATSFVLWGVVLNSNTPLNTQGYAASTPDVSGIYTYDPQGHQIEWTSANVKWDYIYDSNGNLIKEINTSLSTNAVTRTIVYTYTDKRDLRVDGLDWLYGKRSTNLAASKTTYPGSTTTSGITETYTYVLDNRERVTMKTITQEGDKPQAYTYTYFN